MKKQIKKKKSIIIILIILLIIGIYFLLKKDNIFFKDDIIFFKNLYSSINNTKENKDTVKNDNSNNYNIIKVSTKKQTTKEMSLFSNLNNQINWNKIIYPGTSGEFEIKLYGQENLQYEVTFKSKNQKPKNLVFKQNGKEYETLEELGENLKGNLQKDEIRNIVIEWKWEYETNEKQDMQDTKDGEEIKKYNFEIIVKGNEIV